MWLGGSSCLVLNIFWAPYQTKCPRDLVIEHCPDDAKTVRHQTCRTQNPWFWTEHEKLKFTDSWFCNSCHRVVSVHEVTFSSALQPTKHNALWPCSRHGHLLQPKHDAHVVQMHWLTRLCFSLTWGFDLMGNQLQACPQHHKNNGTRDHQGCVLTGPRSWWGMEQWVCLDFNRSVTRRQQKCASLAVWSWNWLWCKHLWQRWKQGRLVVAVWVFQLIALRGQGYREITMANNKQSPLWQMDSLPSAFEYDSRTVLCQGRLLLTQCLFCQGRWLDTVFCKGMLLVTQCLFF